MTVTRETPVRSSPPVLDLTGLTSPGAGGERAPAPGEAPVAPRVLGLDLSLTATGLAGLGWCELVTSKGHDGDTWPMREARLRGIRDRVLEFAMKADLVVIEGPSYGSVSRSTWDRAGLWWSIVSVLASCDIGYAVVSPIQRLMYATGSGATKNSKGKVLEAVVRRYPEYVVSGDDNLADAVIFMAMGMRAAGHPIEVSLPLTHLRAMDKVDWPVRP